MSEATAHLIALLLTGLSIALALTVAWIGCGRPRHAASWAIAFGLSAAQTALRALSAARPDLVALRPIARVVLLLSAAMFAVGALQRRSPKRTRIGPLVAVPLYLVLVLGANMVPALAAFVPASGIFFTMLMLGVAALAILPRERAGEPAEWLAAAALGLFAAYELLLGSAVVRTDLPAADPASHHQLDVIYGIGLAPMTVAAGISVILLLTADLAAQLRRLAANDPLTGVCNRRGFREAAVRAIALARRQRTPVTVVLADIDHFKAINDAHGHTAGDRTLCFIADQLSGGVRRGDLVARVGGEEFALLLIDSSAADARDVVERIRRSISVGHGQADVPIPVTVSFGVGEIVPDAPEPDLVLDRALDAADRALYLSKVAGRNRVTIAA